MRRWIAAPIEPVNASDAWKEVIARRNRMRFDCSMTIMERTLSHVVVLVIGLVVGYFASLARPERYTAFCPVPPAFPNKPESRQPYDMSDYIRAMGGEFLRNNEAIILPKNRDFIVLLNVTEKEMKTIDEFFIPSLTVGHRN
jgi:hypothetical protein